MNSRSEEVETESVWLGKLDEANHLYCHLKPFAELIEGRWVKLEDRLGRFPLGKVKTSSRDLKHLLQKGSCWVFGVRAKGTGTDPIEAEQPARAISMIDLSHLSLDQARRRLTETGVQLPQHQRLQAVVLLEGGTYHTFKFEPVPRKNNAWTARVPEDGMLELREADPAWHQSMHDGDIPFLPAIVEPAGKTVRRVDWSVDTEILARVVGRLKNAVQALSPLLVKGTEVSLKKLERALTDGKWQSDEHLAIEALAERLRSEWPDLSRSVVAIETIGKLLLDSDEGKKLLEAALAARTSELARDIELKMRLEIEDGLAPLKVELAALVTSCEEARGAEVKAHLEVGRVQARVASTLLSLNDVETALLNGEARLHTLAVQIAPEEARLRALATKVEEAKREEETWRLRVDRVRSEVGGFAERIRTELESSGSASLERLSGLTGRLEGLFAAEGAPVAPLLPPTAPPWWYRTGDIADPVRLSELAGRLTGEAENHGVLPEDLLILDAFARAGELVLLTGPQADLALSAYARAVAGGGLRVHALDPGVIGLDDFWRSPTSGGPTAFAWAWQRAVANPQETVLVCLRGIDAAPMMLWMASLAAALRSPDRPSNVLVVATTSSDGSGQSQGRAQDVVESLRHYLVPLRPRAHPDGATAPAVLGEAKGPPSSLVIGGPPTYSPTPSAILAIAKMAREPRSVRRAGLLLRSLGETQPEVAGALAATWAGVLSDPSAQGLPPSLVDGYLELDRLDIRS